MIDKQKVSDYLNHMHKPFKRKECFTAILINCFLSLPAILGEDNIFYWLIFILALNTIFAIAYILLATKFFKKDKAPFYKITLDCLSIFLLCVLGSYRIFDYGYDVPWYLPIIYFTAIIIVFIMSVLITRNLIKNFSGDKKKVNIALIATIASIGGACAYILARFIIRALPHDIVPFVVSMAILLLALIFEFFGASYLYYLHLIKKYDIDKFSNSNHQE